MAYKDKSFQDLKSKHQVLLEVELNFSFFTMQA